jgi:hypothetical protein
MACALCLGEWRVSNLKCGAQAHEAIGVLLSHVLQLTSYCCFFVDRWATGWLSTCRCTPDSSYPFCMIWCMDQATTEETDRRPTMMLQRHVPCVDDSIMVGCVSVPAVDA